MTLPATIAVVLGAWTTLAALSTAGWTYAAIRAKAATRRAEVNWIPVLPPVPPPARPSRRYTDHLEGYELDAAFYDVLSGSYR